VMTTVMATPLTPARDRRAGPAGTRLPDEARIITARTRKAR
jgi:hypothetical protein